MEHDIMKTDSKIALGALAVGVAAFFWARKHTKGTAGIGAVKRRIYKELSLAQQAGVDFTKPYDELTKDEIKALERVSHDTGYTETYYKSLQKAYNAISGTGRKYEDLLPTVSEYSRYLDIAQNQFGISREQARKKYGLYTIGQWNELLGIGETYDVTNADGDTVLTWIENPETHKGSVQVYDDPERYRALREAHDIEDERQWAAQNKSRAMDEMEVQLAEQRKRLKKAGRSSQMSLFGCGYTDDIERELYEIWREQIEYGETEYDYPTWRNVMGDEYVQDVIRYMR